MITIKFLKKGNSFVGFHIKGHAMYKNCGSDIICSAISSVAYMTLNTITDVIVANVDVNIDESGEMYVCVKNDVSECQNILKGFYIHIKGLESQYPQNILLVNSEV